MSPREAFGSVLEAICMVDVRSFIAFLVSLPKEFTKLCLEVIEGYRLSIPESPKASPVLRIDSAEVAACNATVEQCAIMEAPVHRMAKAVMKGGSPKFFYRLALDKNVEVSASPKFEPGFDHYEDMFMMILIVVACYILIKAYAYFRRIASRAFKKWQKANVSSLVIMPDHIQFTDPNEFEMPTPKVSPIYQDTWTPYSDNESLVSTFFLDTVTFANQRFLVLDFEMSRNSSKSSPEPEPDAPQSKEAEREWTPREWLAGIEIDLDRIGRKLDKMKRDPMTSATVMFAAPRCNVPELNPMFIRSYHEFAKVIITGQNLMTWAQACITCMGNFEGLSESQSRKALLLNERINEIFTLFQNKFGFDEAEFIGLMEEFETLIDYLPDGGWSEAQQALAREAYEKLGYFLPRKGALLTSFLDECLDNVRQCVELRNCVANEYPPVDLELFHHSY